MIPNELKKIIRRVVPRPKLMLRKIYYFPFDTLEKLAGRRDPLTPPRSLTLLGAEHFREVGGRFLEFFKELGGLQPGERVLEVGCGAGRMAVPLTRYLGRGGSYEGFDVAVDEVRWCQKNISARYPQFHFHVSDVFNGAYNPAGRAKPSEYRFPYEDESFDFVLLTSVFTHMLPDDTENYLREVTRVLKSGGRCLTTFFLLTGESLRLVHEGKSRFAFVHDYGTYRVVDPELPEAAVAYREDFVLPLFGRCGLHIRPGVYYGNWCGRSEHLDFQDILIAYKS